MPGRRLDRPELKLIGFHDKEAIHEIIHRYCRAADCCDLEARPDLPMSPRQQVDVVIGA